MRKVETGTSRYRAISGAEYSGTSKRSSGGMSAILAPMFNDSSIPRGMKRHADEAEEADARSAAARIDDDGTATRDRLQTLVGFQN